MNLKETIKRILREQLSPTIKRRLRATNFDELIHSAKLTSFNPDNSVEDCAKTTINKVANETFPDEDFLSDEEMDREWRDFKKFLTNKYYKELTEYFTNKKEKYDNKVPDPFTYTFIKHDNDGHGFSETFIDIDTLISKYGDWVSNLNWDEITDKLNDINYFPNNNFTGKYSSNRLLISRIKDEGNKWGYNFSIVKNVPKEYLDMETKKLK